MKTKTLYTLALMTLAGSTIAQPAFLSNGGFETWATQNTVSEPHGWYTLNSLSLFGYPETTTQTSEAHSGSSAALLESKTGPFNDIPGLLTSALIIDGSGTPDLNLAKVPFSSRPKTMEFYYKYIPATGDSCRGVMVLSRWNTAEQRTDTIGLAGFSIGDTVNTYTRVVIPFDYANPLAPDSVMLIFASSADGFAPVVGSKFYVDDFALGYETGLGDYVNTLQNVSVFPNPATTQVTIATQETAFTCSIFDLQGRLVLNATSFVSEKTVETGELRKGLYVLEVKSKNGTARQRIMIK